MDKGTYDQNYLMIGINGKTRSEHQVNGVDHTRELGMGTKTHRDESNHYIDMTADSMASLAPRGRGPS